MRASRVEFSHANRVAPENTGGSFSSKTLIDKGASANRPPLSVTRTTNEYELFTSKFRVGLTTYTRPVVLFTANTVDELRSVYLQHRCASTCTTTHTRCNNRGEAGP
jgi:hypothetical protein